jgi:hypothetical protein
VSGQVRLANGSPAVGIRVWAMAASRPGEPAVDSVLESITTTDGTGRYRLSGISPGRYHIVAGSLTAPTFHPGRPGEATILTIEPGSNATDLNFTIPRVMPATPATTPTVYTYITMPVVAGKVVMENGTPPPFFLGTLYIYSAGAETRASVGEDGHKIRRSGTGGATPVGRNGAFSLPLHDGEYNISLITSPGIPLSPSDGYYVKSMTFGTTDVLGVKFRVGSNSPPLITITLAAGAQPNK